MDLPTDEPDVQGFQQDSSVLGVVAKPEYIKPIPVEKVTAADEKVGVDLPAEFSR